MVLFNTLGSTGKLAEQHRLCIVQEAAKKKARSERFGTAAGATEKTGTTGELQEKLASRAQRFGLETKASGDAGKAKPAAAASKPALTPEEEAKRQVGHDDSPAFAC